MAGILLSAASSVVLAHNTNVTHPVITLEAIRLIQHHDQLNGEFAELYRIAISNKVNDKEPFHLLWGAWNSNDRAKIGRETRIYDKMEIAEAEDDIFFDPYETIYKNNDVNIMSGVIREDHPLNKVLSHFYHAYSGIPLSFSESVIDPGKRLNATSKERAIEFFVRSINQYGYDIGFEKPKT